MCRNHRDPVQCIVPPNILRHLAKSGDPEVQDAALRTLAIDTTIRFTRAIVERDLLPAERLTSATIASPQRSIYDAKDETSTQRTSLLRSEGQPASPDSSANEAYDGLGATFQFYWQVFQRNSIDGAGLPLVAFVHYGQKYDNAFWDGQEMVFGDGDGVLFGRFTAAVDVIGHELTHGVTGSEANLDYTGQSGALNESVSDVFGSMIKQYSLGQTSAQADWLIGAGLLAPGVNGKALRSMENPGTAYDDPRLGGKDPQPDSMAGYVQTTEDNGGVHLNSGIPNRAFTLFAKSLGGNSWDRAGQVWYDTLRDRSLRKNATFRDFAHRTSINASHRYGAGGDVVKALQAAWTTVGVKA